MRTRPVDAFEVREVFVMVCNPEIVQRACTPMLRRESSPFFAPDANGLIARATPHFWKRFRPSGR
jgi:hypothetical protein